MSLYHEVADVLTGDSQRAGSLKSRVYGNTSLKSPPAQVYALAIETCKWSSVLKEVIENSSLLSHERKLTPVLSLLLVHDLFFAKRGISLPASHGLRVAAEKHKARLQAELTKARLRRSLSSTEALKNFIDSGEAETTSPDLPYPRWVRINTMQLELDEAVRTVFNKYERVQLLEEVRPRGPPRLYLDSHIPNLVAVPSCIDLTKTAAYKAGSLILQDKASCFPAYLLNHYPGDGDVIDGCAAPGNKTTHLAAILLQRSAEGDQIKQRIHAFERDIHRASTLQRMVSLAGSDKFTTIHAGQDFLKVNPTDPVYENVGALLLDPSCSGSGIVGRDEMPELHLPASAAEANPRKANGKAKAGSTAPHEQSKNLKRKRENEEPIELMVDDDGNTTAVATAQDLQNRLAALSSFQLSLLLHAFSFPSARKITYSTCSIHAEENESVVMRALASPTATKCGWRILKRGEQVRGMKEWPVRGVVDACPDQPEVAEACIRANKGDDLGTMGFFVAGFVRDVEDNPDSAAIERGLLRDERGVIVRDAQGMPVRAGQIKAAEGEQAGSTHPSATRQRSRTSDDAEIEKRLVRDSRGVIIRDRNGIPIRPGTTLNEEETDGDDDADEERVEGANFGGEWSGFSDDGDDAERSDSTKHDAYKLRNVQLQNPAQPSTLAAPNTRRSGKKKLTTKNGRSKGGRA